VNPKRKVRKAPAATKALILSVVVPVDFDEDEEMVTVSEMTQAAQDWANDNLDWGA
jgi:hypothetical protein